MDASGLLRNRWFAQTAIFAFVVMMPLGVYYYLQWPDWSWLYYLPAGRVEAMGVFAVWIAYPLAVLLGFALAAAFVRGDSPRVSLVIPAIGLAALTGVSVFALDRFLNLTTYELYHTAAQRGREALPKVWDDSVWLISMGLSGLYVGIPLAFLLFRNLRESRAGLLPPARP